MLVSVSAKSTVEKKWEDTNLRVLRVDALEDVSQRGLASLGHESARGIRATVRGNIMTIMEAIADQLIKVGARIDVFVVW